MSFRFAGILVLVSFPILMAAQTGRDRAMRLPEVIRDKVFREQISTEWSKDGRSLSYRVRTGPKAFETVRIDLETGERTTAAAEQPVVQELTWEGPHRSKNGSDTSFIFENRLAKRIEMLWVDAGGKSKSYGFVQPGESKSMHTFAGHAWLIKESTGRELGWFYGTNSPARVVIEEATLPKRLEKDGTKKTETPRERFFIRDHNVFVRQASGAEAAITTDGSAKNEYRAPFHISLDGKRLLVMQTEPEQEHLVYFVESNPKGQTQPKLHKHQYLKPGDRIAHPHPRLIDLTSRKVTSIAEDLMPNPWSLTEVHWSLDSSQVFFIYNQRGHQLLRLVAVNANTGAARVVIEETSQTFIDYSQKTFLHWLDKTNEAIWMSERSGWNHLWLYDTKNGTVKNAITKGEWVVRKVEHVDEAARQVWFFAGGVVAGQDPYYQHLCRVNFDGSSFVVLTEGDGTHEIEFSPDRRVFIDQWSRVDAPPVHELRRSDTGKLITKLEAADASALMATGWKAPERFVAKGRDGKTDIFGVIYKPANFDAAKKYPVVEEIYAGPHGAFVPKAWGLQQRQHQMAELGFIVVQIDGMGTNWRSRAFHDVCWKNLKDAGLPDRIAWMKEAAKDRPWMDLSRVGIYGGSAGGQNVGAAMLHHGDFYKAGVADCGCHDNRMDKIWWNEAWMGWPIGSEYADNSNVTHAKKLTGKLMLIVGEMDTNVDPASTMQVAAALTKAGKDYELVVVPGTGHGAAETPFGFRKRMDFLEKHLLNTEPANRP